MDCWKMIARKVAGCRRSARGGGGSKGGRGRLSRRREQGRR